MIFRDSVVTAWKNNLPMFVVMLLLYSRLNHITLVSLLVYGDSNVICCWVLFKAELI